MGFWRRFFGLGPSTEETLAQAQSVSKQWFDSYRQWCAEQVCEGGCGAIGKDASREKPWVTETVCMECWRKGARPTPDAGRQWRNGPDFARNMLEKR
jgi:hypothetical protein